MQIEDLPILAIGNLQTDAQLQLILDVRQRRRFVAAKPQRTPTRSRAPVKGAVNKLSNEQLQRLAILLGLKE